MLYLKTKLSLFHTIFILILVLVISQNMLWILGVNILVDVYKHAYFPFFFYFAEIHNIALWTSLQWIGLTEYWIFARKTFALWIISIKNQSLSPPTPPPKKESKSQRYPKPSCGTFLQREVQHPRDKLKAMCLLTIRNPIKSLTLKSLGELNEKPLYEWSFAGWTKAPEKETRLQISERSGIGTSHSFLKSMLALAFIS